MLLLGRCSSLKTLDCISYLPPPHLLSVPLFFILCSVCFIWTVRQQRWMWLWVRHIHVYSYKYSHAHTHTHGHVHSIKNTQAHTNSHALLYTHTHTHSETHTYTLINKRKDKLTHTHTQTRATRPSFGLSVGVVLGGGGGVWDRREGRRSLTYYSVPCKESGVWWQGCTGI